MSYKKSRQSEIERVNSQGRKHPFWHPFGLMTVLGMPSATVLAVVFGFYYKFIGTHANKSQRFLSQGVFCATPKTFVVSFLSQDSLSIGKFFEIHNAYLASRL